MKWVLLTVALFIGAVVEALVIQLPFVMLLLLLAFMFSRKQWVVFLSIPAGILLDSLTFRTLGQSSIFFAIFLGIFFAYEKKFEVNSVGFMIFATLMGTLSYLLIFGSQYLIIQTILSLSCGLVFFFSATFVQSRWLSSSRKELYA